MASEPRTIKGPCINAWLGRSQAEQAKEQDAEIQRMNRELQERAKEKTDGI